jgi:hypothetical protein
MAQHDYIIANQSGAAFRSDLNNGLAAIVSQNSGAAQPSTTYAYMWWADTTTGLLKIRNAANNAWITVGTLGSANLGLLSLAGGTLTGALLLDDSGTVSAPALAFDGDTNTGIWRSAADTLNVATNGVERVEFGTTEVVFNDGGGDFDFRIEGDTNANLFKIDAGLDQVQVANLNGGPLAGFRNRIINGLMTVNQRGSSSLSSGLSTVTYFLDRWFGFATGAAVTLSQVSNGFRVTGAASNTAAIIGQRIEAANSGDLAGATVTLSFLAASSNSVTLNWKASYAGSTDNFTSSTQSNTGTVSTTSSLTRYSVTFTLNGAATTGIQIEFFVNNFTSGTFDINGVQLEPGPVATPLERRPIGTELGLCQKYFESGRFYGFGYAPGAGTYRVASAYLQTTKRVAPSIVFSSATGSNVSGQTAEGIATGSFGVATSVIGAGAYTLDALFTASAEL